MSATLFLQKIRWLTQALIISGALNVGLLATFIYFVVSEKQDAIPFDNRPATAEQNAPSGNEELLRSYSTLTFSDLLMRLENKELAEDGFLRRDLALASLVAFHHFNLDRALGGLQLQKRNLFFRGKTGEEMVNLTVFPGLADYQFEAILHYAKTERWPFTSQGLFYEIKRAALPRDPTLLEAFYLTPEFHSVVTLFSRSGALCEKENLAQMVSEGEWKVLTEFAEQQRAAQDVSPQRRRALTLSFLNYRSKTAALLLLQLDKEFILKRFDDTQLSLFLDLFAEKSEPIETLCKEILSSPRSDQVRKRAATKLYAFAGETLTEPFDYESAALRFSAHHPPQPAMHKKQAPTTAVVSKPQVAQTAGPRPKARRIHVVEYGETLSKIARKYRVSIDAIKRQNRLENDKLKEGKHLEIP